MPHTADNGALGIHSRMRVTIRAHTASVRFLAAARARIRLRLIQGEWRR